jgi:uncharacterized SAM-binding protein YcdF (DUF218 family)
MLFLNKLLPIFVLPLGVVFLLLLVALWRRKRWPAIVAAAVLYLSSIDVVAGNLIGWLESRYPAVPIAEAGKADAIVVLGGIFGPPVKPGFLVNLGDGVERLEGGIVLHQKGAAPWLVFTGGRIPWQGRTKVEGEDSRDVAMARGIPENKILITREVGNTADEAKAVAAMMQERGWKRIILVTTGWHMPRAAWLFRRTGVECTIFPVDFRGDPARPITLLDFLPKGEALANTETALREIYGNLFYRLFH